MDEQIVNAETGDTEVSTTVESTTDTSSADVEQTTSTESVSSEKTEGTTGTENAQDKEDGGNAVPYERFSEVNSKMRELEQANQELSQKAALLDRLQQDPTIAQEFLKRMPKGEGDPRIEAANKQLAEMGYVRQEDVQQMVQEQIRTNELRSKVVSKFDELESKYTGDDGLPKFDREKVTEYMDKYGWTNDEFGVPDVERTFKMMNMESFIDSSAKAKKGTFSEKPGQPQQTSSSRTEEDSAIKSAKETGDWSTVFGMRSSKFKK